MDEPRPVSDNLPAPMRGDLERYVRALRSRFGDDLVTVVLFGSWARGEGRAESDLDVLVVVRGLRGGVFDRYAPVREPARAISEDFSERLSLIVASPESAAHVKPYYLGMLSGHVLLYDAGGFFAAVLDRLRARLRELGSRRYVDEDGYEYWDLKPDWKPGDVVSL